MTDEQKAVLYDRYLGNGMKRLKSVTMSQVYKFNSNSNMNLDDFYSIANMTFWQVIETYDDTKSVNFDGYLARCLHNKFLSELTKLNNNAPITASEQSVPIDAVREDCLGLAETIDSGECTEDCINEYGLTDKAFAYVNSFHGIYKKVLLMIMDGTTDCDIMKILGITRREFNDVMDKLKSYKYINKFFTE